MKSLRHFLLLGLLVFGTMAYSAPPHSVTYTPLPSTPGQLIDISGNQFVVVTVGIGEFTSDKRYIVRFPSPLHDGNYVNAVLLTRHSIDPLPNQNATISSFPAHIEVSDGRSYAVNTTYDPNIDDLTNKLQVLADATLTLQVKVGDTLLYGFASLTQQNQDVDIGQDSYHGASRAVFTKYVDPTYLTSGLDKWIDYVAIIPLN